MSEVEQVTFIDNLVTGQFQAYTDEMFGATDPDLNYVWLSPTTAIPPIALNFARNKDDALEAALQKGRTTSDPSERIQAYQEVDKRLSADLPYLWASLATWSLTGSNSVQNFNNLTLPDGSQGPGVRRRRLRPDARRGARTERRLPMLRFIATRLVQLVVICFLISVVAFLLVHLLPGDPTLAILGPNDTPAARAVLLTNSGSTRASSRSTAPGSPTSSTATWASSFLTKQTVTNALSVAVPIDLELIVVSQVLALLVAIPMALFAALRPNRAFDRVATTSTFAMLSLPTFVAGPLLVLVFAVTLKWVPATGFIRLSQGLGPNLKSVILPSVALAIGSITVYYRLLRADLIATLQEDFVTMARSKGLSTRYILMRHVMRPSSFSLLAGAGISIGTLFTGAFVVEVLFQLPGHRVPARPGHLLAATTWWSRAWPWWRPSLSWS